MTEEKRPAHLRLVKPEGGGFPEPAAKDVSGEERPWKINFKVMDPNGQQIFVAYDQDLYAIMEDPGNIGYRSFFYLDEWIDENRFKRTYIRPGFQNAIHVEIVDSEPRPFEMIYPEDEEELKNIQAYSFELLDNKGRCIWQRDGLTSWDFLEDTENEGYGTIIALDVTSPDGKVLKRDLVRPSVHQMVVIRTVITIK